MKENPPQVLHIETRTPKIIVYFLVGFFLTGIALMGIFHYIIAPTQYQKTLTEISLFQEIVRNETDIRKCNNISHDEMRAKCQDNLRSNDAIFSARPKNCLLVQDGTLQPLCIKYASQAFGKGVKDPKECLDLPAEGATICREFTELQKLQ